VQSRYQIDIWVDIPIEQASQSFALWRINVEPENNGTRMRCGRDDLAMFVAMLLTLNRRIIVHSPPELLDTFRELARRSRAVTLARKPKAPAKPGTP